VAVACKRCYWCAKNVGGLNLLANTVLFAVKLTGGIFGKSQTGVTAMWSLSYLL